MTSTSNLYSEAFSHRVQAVGGLKALSNPPKTAADGDAILDTCYAPALQASFIGESVEKFLTMMHGCQLVMAQGWTRKLGTVFKSLSHECQLEVASARLNKLPVVDPT
jgi:hypothetical protein